MEQITKLYQYKPFNKFTIINLLNNYIRVNSPALFNDPYDCRIMAEDDVLMDEYLIQGKGFDKDKLAYIKKNNIDEYNEAISRFKEIMESTDEFKNMSSQWKKRYFDYVNNNVYISCFTETNNSILMWSHYADNHRGICIEYSKKAIEEKENFELKLRKVNYVKEHKKIDITNEKLRNELIESFAIKDVCWEYENEWRIIYLNKSSQNGFNIQMEKPTAIYMGSKINDEDRELIEEICKEKKINLYKMKLSLDTYKLNRKLIYKFN